MTKDEQWLLDEKYGGERTSAYEADVKRLACGEPLAYVIGHIPFLGLKISLDSKPLIPRPETEWWTEQLIRGIEASSAPITGLLDEPAVQNLGTLRAGWPSLTPIFRTADSPERAPGTSAVGVDAMAQMPAALRSRRESGPMSASRQAEVPGARVLDLCAGSGAIGCAVLKDVPDAQVYFGEIDPAHKSTILKNVRENNLDESRTTIRIGDLFEPFGGTRFDIIAANPPYIPASRPLDESVADYEPALALFAGEDGLDLIRRIAKELPDHLTKGGVAWIECDTAHAAAACALFEVQGLKAHVINDQYEASRIVVVSFP